MRRCRRRGRIGGRGGNGSCRSCLRLIAEHDRRGVGCGFGLQRRSGQRRGRGVITVFVCVRRRGIRTLSFRHIHRCGSNGCSISSRKISSCEAIRCGIYLRRSPSNGHCHDTVGRRSIHALRSSHRVRDSAIDDALPLADIASMLELGKMPLCNTNAGLGLYARASSGFGCAHEREPRVFEGDFVPTDTSGGAPQATPRR